jgi:SAM-dependent methyltransferase
LKLLASVPGRVLDYGCGYGDVTHAISRRHEVVGVDVDPARISFAAREYAPIPFTICETDTLPFSDSSFDIVASVAVIHFAPDPARYLEEAKRVLRTNGHLAIACISPPVVRNRLRRWIGKGPVRPRLWVPTKSEFRAFLAAHGFQIKKERWFYDPPFEGWRNAGDFFFGMIQQCLSLFRISATANYYLFLAMKSG